MDYRKCTSFSDASSLSMAPVTSLNKSCSKSQFEEQEKTADPALAADADVDLREVYFLIMHFLSSGPCQKTFGQFRNELLEYQLLPRRYHAWYSRSGASSGHQNDNGNSFPLSYDSLVERNLHIEKDHLVKLLKRLMLSKAPPLRCMARTNTPSAVDVPTLLGSGSFSLLGCGGTEVLRQLKPLPSYFRWPHMQADQVHGLGFREVGGGFPKHHRAPSVRFACYAIAKPSTMVQKMQNIKRLRGHRNAVYCAIFDRSGRYLITGSDDRLVKIWSMETAFCLSSCRGHEGDITDLAVSFNNALVASASNDYSIRVWRLPDGLPISVLRGHEGAVTAIAFSPRPSAVYQLLSSSDDGSCRIWDARYSQFSPRIYLPKLIKDGKSATPSLNNVSQSHQIFCCAYNSNGTVFVTGSSDTYARVWSACKSNDDDLEQPNHEIDLLAGHENDVNYVQFSGCAVVSRPATSDSLTEDKFPRFKNSWFSHDNIVTCSRDGSAIIWIPRARRSYGKVGSWMRAYHLKVPPPPLPPRPPRGGPRQRFLPTPRGVNMIVWSLDNRFVLAAIMDCRICVWNASDGSLVHSLTGHSESTYVLDVHPFNPRIAMSAGYDGKTIVWDIWEGVPIRIYEIGRFKLVDGKFSPDGTSIVLSDDVGQIYLINTGQGESQKDAKYDQFFLGDYRPLIQDTHGNFLDQETQLTPYRRNIQDPLCDSSMLPYPEPYQSMYQRRRLGALGIEWRPSSIKYAVGTDTNLGQEYQVLPLADLDLLVEPPPEFIDVSFWEPENDVVNDDSDSEYNVTEEDISEGERGSLSDTSSNPEISEDNKKVDRSRRDGFCGLKRKNFKTDVELKTSSGRRIKRRNMDDLDDYPSDSKSTKTTRNGRKTLKRKSSKSKSSRPLRVAARNAVNSFSQITAASTGEENEDGSEDDSSETDSSLHDSDIQNDEADDILQSMQHKYSISQQESHAFENHVKLPQCFESQTGADNRRSLVIKFPIRDSKKSLPSDYTKNEYDNVDALASLPSVSSGKIQLSSGDSGQGSENANDVEEFKVTKKTNFRDNVGDHAETFGSLQNTKTGREDEVNVGNKEIASGDANKSSLHDFSLDLGSASGTCNQNSSNSYREHSVSHVLGGYESVVDREHSSEIKVTGNRPSKPIVLRIKTKKNSGESSSTKLRCITSVDVPATEFPEATNNTMGRTRSMSLMASSLDANALNHSFQVREDNMSRGAAKSAKRSRLKAIDQLPSEERRSTPKLTIRSRSSRNNGDGYNGDDRNPLARREPSNLVRKSNWLVLAEQEEGYRYIPQSGDEVVYLRQGHQEYLESSRSSEVGPWILLGENIRAVEFCLVDGLDYATLPGSGESGCKITLKIMDSSSSFFDHTFKLTLPELIDFPDFIVERTRYDTSIKRNWSPRDKCLVWWKDDNEEGGCWWEGRIISSNDKSSEFPGSPWQRYVVKYKNDDSGPYFHCPWELNDLESQWEQPNLDRHIRDKLLSAFAKLQQSASGNQDSYGILKLRQASTKFEFINRFPVPLSPDIIESRLENNYYRSLAALKHDMSVMVLNAQTYFAKNAELLSKWRRLSEWLAKTTSKL